MALGWKSVEAGLREISSRELSEWLVYARLYGPLNSNERADWRIAQLTAVLANVYRGKKKKPLETSDFMPKFGAKEASEDQSAEYMLTVIEQMNIAFGGRDLRGSTSIQGDLV